MINYLLKKGIVHTKLGANILLLIAFFAISGLNLYLLDKQQVDIKHITDRDGNVYLVEDYIKKIESESSSSNRRN